MTNFAIYQTDFGYLKINYEQDFITGLKKVHSQVHDFGEKTVLSNQVYEELVEYFAGKRKDFTCKYKLKGTDFQRTVWNALCDIPYGEVRSYKDIAIAVGNPKASRAIGMANNKNPIGIIVPCHRVIGANGKLVGYASGLDMKSKLLELEKNNK